MFTRRLGWLGVFVVLAAVGSGRAIAHAEVLAGRDLHLRVRVVVVPSGVGGKVSVLAGGHVRVDRSRAPADCVGHIAAAPVARLVDADPGKRPARLAARVDHAGAAIFAFGSKSIAVSTNGGRTWRGIPRLPSRRAIRRYDWISPRIGYALVEGGVDLLLVETAFDTLVLKAALFAIDEYFTRRGFRLPVMASFTVFQGGRTLSGQTVEACWISIAAANLLSVGINCALGPSMLRPYIEELSAIAPRYTSCYPNAGLPNAFGGFDETPEMMAQTLGEFLPGQLDLTLPFTDLRQGITPSGLRHGLLPSRNEPSLIEPSSRRHSPRATLARYPAARRRRAAAAVEIRAARREPSRRRERAQVIKQRDRGGVRGGVGALSRARRQAMEFHGLHVFRLHGEPGVAEGARL